MYSVRKNTTLVNIKLCGTYMYCCVLKGQRNALKKILKGARDELSEE
jgi:hypothetical protein